jgi:hypothetical protein
VVGEARAVRQQIEHGERRFDRVGFVERAGGVA